MEKSIDLRVSSETVVPNTEEIATTTVELLQKNREELLKNAAISVPITQLAALGAGVSALIPSLRTVTQTTAFNTEGLYRVVNKAAGDGLKKAQNGEFWGAIKSADGASKMARFQETGQITATSTATMPIDPATLMIAAALFAIEQKLDKIAEISQKILFMQTIEKDAEVEADIEKMAAILAAYKHNWNNNVFLSGNYVTAETIETRARKHMFSYQKRVKAILEDKKLFISQATVSNVLEGLLKEFKYYRLSLYTFTMAAFIKVILSENYTEENIMHVKTEIEQMAMAYRDSYAMCSVYLEKLSDSAVEANLLKGVSTVSKAAGKIIGSIPVINKGSVDEFLQESGEQLGESALASERKTVAAFAEISNPGTAVFLEKLDDMIQIYSRTTDICFDDKNIYLIAG